MDSLLSSRSHVEADTCREPEDTCHTGSGTVDVPDADKLETRQTVSRTLSGTNIININDQNHSYSLHPKIVYKQKYLENYFDYATLDLQE